MSPKKCGKCMQTLPRKQFVTCSLCKISYDIDCAQLEKLFFLMNKERRNQWTCKICKNDVTPYPIENRVSTPVSQNVTIRPKHTTNLPSTNSFDSFADTISDSDVDIEGSTLFESNLNRSCPQLETTTREEMEQLQKIIMELRTKLSSAEKEIDNLSLENGTLKKKITTLETKISKLKQVCGSSTKKQCKRQKKERNLYMGINQSFENLNIETEKEPTIYTPPILDPKISNGQNIGKNGEISQRHKIIVISDQQGKYVRSNLQELLGGDFHVSSVIKSGAKLGSLLKNETKTAASLTKNDYMIIAGGINDDNPYDVLNAIEKFLNHTTNTNIIIAEIPYNNNMSVDKLSLLNYEIRYICNQFEHATFLDVEYWSDVPAKRRLTINLCRSLLRDILRIRNRMLCIDSVNQIENLNANTDKQLFRS